MKPEGQWLRQEHLGIEADQMSGSLLGKLSQGSHHRYASDLLLPPLEEIVPTRAARSAAENLQGSASLHLLVGPSGAGKSVIAQDLLRRHVEGGGAGLWIPSEIADREPSLSGAIERVLRDLHPRAGVGAGHDALKLGTSDQPLLLVVDDINRSSDPFRLLRKVIGWSRPANPTAGATDVAKTFARIVCPAWDAHWYPIRHTYESMSWITVQGIGPMERSEAVACLKATLGAPAGAHTDAELTLFAERLHDDPILLGLFGKLLRADRAANPLTLSENVIGRMTEQAIGELVAVTHTLAADYTGALNRLCVEMIRRRTLHPRWAEVEQWLQSEPAVRSRLAELAAQGHVCRLVQVTGPPRLEFRHDRILEYHLALAAAEMLCGEASDREATLDPFFTAFAGRAMARTEIPGAVLEQFRFQNPVALVAAVPYLPTAPSANTERIVELARGWLDQPGDSPDSMRYAALWTLARASSARVLDVTRGLRGSRLVWEARLRNGDASAGALALSREFSPAVRHTWLEMLIEEARSHHGPGLTEQLRVLLRSPELPDTERFGALCLAGYFGDSGLAADVRFAWEHAHDGREMLLAALWAGCRCAGDAAADLISPMMEYVLILQHDETGQRVDERSSLLRQLGFSSRHGFGEPVLTCLAALGTTREEFRWIVAAILDDVDHPVAVWYVVRVLAESNHQAEQAGMCSPWADIWRDQWRRKESGSEARRSPQSVAALKPFWTNEKGPDWLRSYAFSLWARSVDDLAELSAVPAESPHYESAIWHRAQRGDRTVNSYVLAKLSASPRWFHVVSRVWGEEFEDTVDDALAQIAADPERIARSGSNHHYRMSELLRDIPTEVAERLLVKHWSGLGQLPLFIQAALYHGTQQTRELASGALAQVVEGFDPFQHIGSFFGFFTQGLMDRLTGCHLETLRPYLLRLDDHCLWTMLEYCIRFDYSVWATQYLQPEMRRRVPLAKPDHDGGPPFIVRMTQHFFPTDEELVAELDCIEQIDPRYRAAHLSHWWDQFVERGDAEDRPDRLLFAWLAQTPSPPRFVAAAELVGERGKRRNLQALLTLKPAGNAPEIRRAAADAEFAVKRRSLD